MPRCSTPDCSADGLYQDQDGDLRCGPHSASTPPGEWETKVKPFMREVALSIRILQRQMDDVRSRLEKLEQDRASSPGWEIDEGD